IGEDARRKAVRGSHRTEPGTLQVGLQQALVDACRALRKRHRQQILDAEGEMLTKGGHARADDRDVPHASAPGRSGPRFAAILTPARLRVLMPRLPVAPVLASLRSSLPLAFGS